MREQRSWQRHDNSIEETCEKMEKALGKLHAEKETHAVSRHPNAKMLDVYEAITDILRVFISTEIGAEAEFNNDVIWAYISGFEAKAHFFDCKTKEDIYEQFTQDILDGYPVWRMLKLSDWTMRMVEASFQTELDEKERKAKQVYKCLTCRYYKPNHTSIGDFLYCTNKGYGKQQFGTWNSQNWTRFELEHLRKRCKFYERNEQNDSRTVDCTAP